MIHIGGNKAEKLGERKFHPILDSVRSKLFSKVKEKFRKEFEKEVPFTYVREAFVDDKEAIIVFVDESEETSDINLPAKFEGYPVFINYETFQLQKTKQYLGGYLKEI
jgi:hypothetical protein